MSPQRKRRMRRNYQKRIAARRAIPKLLRQLAEAFAEVYKPFAVVVYRRVRRRRHGG